jgi:hypothetical protein
LAGAEVFATDEYSFQSTHFGSTKTDSLGYFSLSGIPEGEQYLYVFGPTSEYWVSGVTPFTMNYGKGTGAADTFLCKGFNSILPSNSEVIHDNYPTLMWNTFPGAVDYSVYVMRSDNKGGYLFTLGIYDDVRTPYTSIKVDVYLNPGEYKWGAGAFNEEGLNIDAVIPAYLLFNN